MEFDFGPEVCGSVPDALRREWLETDGLGGFASSTLMGLNSRRYHGLFVPALRPPTDRYVLLSRVEETLVVAGDRYDLGTNQYPGTIHPRGFQYLVRFRLDPFPIWTFRVGDVELEKQFFLVHGDRVAVLQYSLRAPTGAPDARLEVRPLIAFRDYHSLSHENPTLNAGFWEEDGRVGLRPYPDLPELFLGHNAARVEAQGWWYRRFQYEEERARGLEWEEDLFCPFVLTYDLGTAGRGALIAALEPRRADDAPELEETERRRRASLDGAAPVSTRLVRALSRAADQFVVRRGDGATIVAGYPWFTDWGRDTMIALPGLTLVTGRATVARAILQEFAHYEYRGLLPNRFPDRDEPLEYNTVDATLWYFQAIRAYLEQTGDGEFVRRELYDVLVRVVEHHCAGTLHGIRVDDDGLLSAGEEGYQLTWMDARVGDWVVTPRQGKPVEIQALWYNALRVLEELAQRFGDAPRAVECGNLATRALRSFRQSFWNEASGCLFDVLTPEGPDPSLRPNQLLAVSLPCALLSKAQGYRVVRIVQQKLLTPFGLRTLDPGDPRYAGTYEGDVWSRDSRYHQGTVWPWLLGAYGTALLRTAPSEAKARREVEALLEGFLPHLQVAGLGQISEILDGDAPYTPRGCFAQAWSVAELLRLAVAVAGRGTSVYRSSRNDRR